MSEDTLRCPVCNEEINKLYPDLDTKAHLYKKHSITEVVDAFTNLSLSSKKEEDMKCPICDKELQYEMEVGNHLLFYHPQIHLVDYILYGKKAKSERPPIL